jgi:hypothetical protein
MSATLGGELRPFPLAAEQRHWIASPGFDLIFFILAPLVTAPIVIGVRYSIPLLASIGIVLAVPHYFSTGSFLLWEENAKFQRSQWMAYAGIPLLIAIAFALLVGFHVPLVIQTILFIWTIFHVAAQNCGILGIYRHRAGVTDPRQKKLANLAIISVSAWFSLWFIDTHEDLQPLLNRIDLPLAKWAWIAAGSIAAFALVRLATGLMTRIRAGQAMSLPEAAFLGMSLLMFVPYSLIRDANVGTYVMLLPHYVQYLGIVWLMNRRRAAASPQRDTLRNLSRSLLPLVALLAGIGIAVTVLFMYLRKTTDLTLYSSIFNLVVLEHYYYDGVVWAFRKKHVRQTMTPWLVQPEEAA